MMAQPRGKCESVIVYGDRVITKKRKLSCIDSKFKFIHGIHLVFTCVLYLTTIKTARSFKVLRKILSSIVSLTIPCSSRFAVSVVLTFTNSVGNLFVINDLGTTLRHIHNIINQQRKTAENSFRIFSFN